MTGHEPEHLWLDGDGVRLHAVAAGPPDGRPVVLLHGFPEFWYGWRHLLGPLASAGFRAVAPDQRGYAASDKPPRVADYHLDRLADDVARVIDRLGGRAAVVGHDWGGGVGWHLARRHPDRLTKLVVLNCPHPAAMRLALESRWSQLAKSWYILAAQVPGLPEAAAAVTGHRLLEWVMRASARPGTFTPADFTAYRAAWAEPGAITGMVNWYRAVVRYGPIASVADRVRVPTLLLWGQRDRFLDRWLAPASAALCDDVRLELFPRATHWLHHEEPGRVADRVLRFLSG